MENEPLGEEERAVWASLVERGRELRAPMLARREAERAENARRMAEARGETAEKAASWKRRPKSVAVSPIPDGVKRWVVYRASGMSFKAAGAASGCTWNDVNMARMKSEEMMCAVAGMEDSSKFLMRMKAMSVVEQSQDEGVRPHAGQVLMAESILKRLDATSFGDVAARAPELPAGEERKELGNGGFVINVVGDAAKVADAAPEKRPGKAMVYTDV